VRLLLVLGAIASAPAASAADPTASDEIAAAAVPAVNWLPTYEAVRAALASDSAEGAATAASSLQALAEEDPALSAAAGKVGSATGLDAQREAFGALSALLIGRLAADPEPPKIFAYYCPMFEGFAYWVQPKPGLENPYMGTAMPTCGEQVSLKRAAKAADAQSGAR
jgi:hypothetical protein